MSKSSGEFLTVSLLQEKGYDPLVYRFFCLNSHYRKSLVFSYENLDNAALAYKKLVSRLAQLLEEKDQGQVDEQKLEELKAPFVEALDNDLNTSMAITALYDALKADASPATRLAAVKDFDRVLMLNLEQASMKQKQEDEIHSDDPFIKEIQAAIAARAQAKKEKNYAEADRIRKELSDQGRHHFQTQQVNGTTFKLNRQTEGQRTDKSALPRFFENAAGTAHSSDRFRFTRQKSEKSRRRCTLRRLLSLIFRIRGNQVLSSKSWL